MPFALAIYYTVLAGMLLHTHISSLYIELYWPFMHIQHTPSLLYYTVLACFYVHMPIFAYKEIIENTD